MLHSTIAPRVAYAEDVRAADLAVLDALIADQEAIFIAKKPRSRALSEEAKGSLAGGVASNWQAARPMPVWIDRGEGSRIWDVDGTEYVDMHGGFGAMMVGHAHPAVVRAVSERIRKGSHFAQPTEDVIVVTR